MSSAEGWAAQRFGLPAQWYADVAETSGIGFPVSGDATAQLAYHNPYDKEADAEDQPRQTRAGPHRRAVVCNKTPRLRNTPGLLQPRGGKP
jgi:hypothetical protein